MPAATHLAGPLVMALSLGLTACGSASPLAADGGDAGASGSDAASRSDTDGSADAATADAGGGLSATLRFVDPAQYILYVTVGGGSPHRVQLDTGSIGLYVPKSTLGASAQVSATPCTITYVSSGNTLSGFEATAPIALLGSTAAGDVAPPPTTVPTTFCAVDDASFDGGVMGVGYGRAADSDPTRNVLLQVADVARGAMRAGYVLSTHPVPHVDVGIAAGAADGFATVTLSADPRGNGDWLSKSLRGCLRVPSAPSFGAPCGPLLVDTGIPECLLWGPADPTLGGVIASGATAVPSGVALAITAEAGAAALDYAFVAGQGADAPSAVDVRTASAFSINTGRALLVDYDYLFDAVGGVVGFRRASAVADAGGD